MAKGYAGKKVKMNSILQVQKGAKRMRRALEMILELDTKRNTKVVYTEAVWFLACWGLEDRR